MSIIYGGALYFSLSALFRMFRFIVKTSDDSTWHKVLITSLVFFFTLATAYIILLHPLLYHYPFTIYAVVIILLPFICREVENALLRRRAKIIPPGKRDIARTILPVQFVFLAATSLLSLLAGANVFLIATVGLAIGLGLHFFRQYTYHDYAAEYPKRDKIFDNIKNIRSARLYDGMVISSEAALNIFAFTYILFIMFSRFNNFLLDFFAVFAVLALVFCIVYITTMKVVRSAWLQKFGKNAAYILGTAIAIFAVYVFRESWYQGVLVISLQTTLLLFGLTLQMTATHGLRDDILLVVKLYDKDMDKQSLYERTSRLSFWSTVISETVIIAVLILLVSNPLFYQMDVTEYIVYAPYVGSTLAVIPTIFLIFSLVYSLKQPLTKKFDRKLKTYTILKSQGKENPMMEKRLTSVLIKKYKKRIGVYIIRAFLKPIMYHTVKGKEHVADLPGIFVFNHGEFYGPIAAVVFLPYDIRPWILDKMIDKEQIMEHIYEGTFSKIKWLPKGLRKPLAKWLSPIIVWALNSFEPVPVYRGTGRNVIKTFTMSVECLSTGDSILLFPENPEQDYEEEVSSFYKGFANLGRMYYKKTGEKVTFYPVFASKRQRVLRIGEGVRYNPDNGKKERDRIVESLERQMKSLQDKDDKKRPAN